MISRLIFSLFFIIPFVVKSQDTIKCCMKLDNYVAPHCGLIAKDSIVYKDKKPFSGILVINCKGDGKSRINNGIYQYESGKLLAKLGDEESVTPSGQSVPLVIKKSTRSSMSGGARYEHGSNYSTTSTFNLSVSGEIQLDSVIFNGYVFILKDTLGKTNELNEMTLQISQNHSGRTGQTSMAAFINTSDGRIFLSQKETMNLNYDENKVLTIHYSSGSTHNLVRATKYDETQSHAAP